MKRYQIFHSKMYDRINKKRQWIPPETICLLRNTFNRNHNSTKEVSMESIWHSQTHSNFVFINAEFYLKCITLPNSLMKKELLRIFKKMSLHLHAQTSIFIFYLCMPKVLPPYESLTWPFYLNPTVLFFLCWMLHNEIPVFTWKSFSSRMEIYNIFWSSPFLLKSP